MLRMLRFRGKRFWYVVFAAFATFLIFRWTHQSESQVQDLDWGHTPGSDKHADTLPDKPVVEPKLPAVNEKAKEADTPPAAEVAKPAAATTKALKPEIVVPKTTATAKPSPSPVPQKNVPEMALPDRQKPHAADDVYGGDEEGEDMHVVDPAGRLEVPILAATTTIHWERQVEHFPVPTGSIIHLPTGEAVTIPRIQHEFTDETTDAKITREKRMNRVKEEFKKAWKGYKDNAWLHDELSPVSGKFRDPFCGWAATLVDSLDTLWIMGLEEEFEDAAKAVHLIDFTTSPRQDIPMFETTIRYLGGLLAAYDVSGGKYKNLLTKATELGDILLGAFDTPNRMPVLYYRWAPAFASQPHRASAYSNTAELGSLSMEFTRLSQLTREPKYYDAIARVTDALSDYQDRGTILDGVFPENIDASGCNKTILPESIPIGASSSLGSTTDAVKVAEEPVGYQLVDADNDAGKTETGTETKPNTNRALENESSDVVKMQIIPGQPEKAKIGALDEAKRTQEHTQFQKRQLSEPPVLTNRTNRPARDPKSGLPVDIPAAKATLASTLGDWDCTPQGLDSASPEGLNKFSMGGGQDSTYEYMSKQYLLLGGQEQKYGKMYLKTIEAVRKHMLFRPMIPDNLDILFSGAVQARKDAPAANRLIAEVEHLTCFIGGMVGMGAKIFGLDKDLEIAKKLTDGCVWAYNAFPTGIMPEGSMVVPCESKDHCVWNETTYWEVLDPMGTTRDEQVEDYIKGKAAHEAELKAAELEAKSKPPPSNSSSETITPKDDLNPRPQGYVGENSSPAKAVSSNDKPKEGVPKSSSGETAKSMNYPDPKPNDVEAVAKAAGNPVGSETLRKDTPASLQKRDLPESSREEDSSPDSAYEKAQTKASDANISNNDTPTRAAEEKDSNADPEKSDKKGDQEETLHNITPLERKYDDFVRVNEVASGRQAEVPLSEAAPKPVEEPLVDPMMPFTHKQYVESRIEQEQLPPGFTNIRSRTYILRPEAIESVWYMYRLTGDTTWQDKGWQMFESILKATSAEFGHSAIYDVTVKDPYQLDEMESFWLAETLKYFYLLYSSPDVISLDEWVLNTEAHPFKRPV